MLDYNADLFRQRQSETFAQRQHLYKRNWEYYHGDQRRTLKVKQGQADDNLTINMARYIVDKGAAFLFGKPVEFQLQEGETTPAEQKLSDIWDRNRKATLLLKMATLGGIYGHVFIGIIPDYYGAGLARLTLLEAEYVEVSWKGDDVEDAWRYVVSWVEENASGKSEEHEQEIVQDANTKRWGVFYRIRRDNGSTMPDPNRADIPIWPYNWPPIIDCQNIPCPGEFYGLSDIEDMDEQDALNYIASLTLHTLRYHAYPKTWVVGAGGMSSEAFETDEAILFDSLNAQIHNLEMQSDLAANLNFYDKIKTALMQGARVPDLNRENLALGAASGFALRIIHGDLLEKTEAKRRTYGDMLIELNRRLLELAGFGSENYCEVIWQDPLPLNATEEQTKDAFELDRGLASKETIRMRRGLDPEAENEKIAAEQDAEDVRNGNVGALLIKQFNQGQNV